MIRQSVKMAWKAISSNKMRSFLTMLGIIIGVLALVVLVSLVSGATSSVNDQISSMGTNRLQVSIADDKDKPLKLTDLEELAAENVSLTTKRVNSMSMDEVEAYAVNELGMVKLDNSQIEYVEVTNPDSVTVAKSGVSLDPVFAGLARSFSAIVEYIR